MPFNVGQEDFTRNRPVDLKDLLHREISCRREEIVQALNREKILGHTYTGGDL